MGNKLLPSTQHSKYNSSLFIGNCKICNNLGQHTHHIIFQCQADKDGMIDFYHKNRMSNLVVLCEECHHKVHSNKIWINGYLDTSSGPILDWGENNINNVKNVENNENTKNLENKESNDLFFNNKLSENTNNSVIDIQLNKKEKLDEYIIESNSHFTKEEIMSTSSEDSNPDHEKGYNDLCQNDNRTYLVNKSLTKYHIKDNGIENKNVSVCRSKAKLKKFNGYPSVFINKICQKCLLNAPL